LAERTIYKKHKRTLTATAFIIAAIVRDRARRRAFIERSDKGLNCRIDSTRAGTVTILHHGHKNIKELRGRSREVKVLFAAFEVSDY